MPKPLRFKQRLDRYPPILIRLLARHGRRNERWVPTDREIATAGALSMAEVKRVSYSTSWDSIPVEVAHRFLTGCGIDLEKRRTMQRLEWMRTRGNFSHLRKSPLFETQFREMVDMWTEAVGNTP